MQSRLRRHVLPILAFVMASVAVLSAQWPTGQIRELLNKASLHRLVEGDPPVTTGLDDALTGIEFLDRFNPSTFAPLAAQPRDGAGGFLVGPGAYEFVAESYCLHAGTHGPGGGDGYVSAPLLGARRDIVRHILQNAVAHPQISQQEIQVLLWAILARTRMSDMPRKTQVTAARLLTARQLVDLQGAALGIVPDRAWQSLPLAARRAYEAETQFRQLLTTVDASFADIERFAVLVGNPASDPASRKIPQGRWSYHPGGYFIRFFPTGYSSTDVQVYVPEPIRLVRDSAGRLAAIANERGRRLDVDNVDLSRQHNRDRTAIRHAAQWRALLEQPASAGAHVARAPRDVRDLVDLAQLHWGMEAALSEAGKGEREGRVSPALEFVTSAWATVFCEEAGGCVSDTRTVDLSETVAVPGSRGRQRLGLSGRGQR